VQHVQRNVEPTSQREEGDMDVKDLMKRVGENLSVGRAFGAAYEKDGLTIIPVALVAGGGGGGGPVSTLSTDHAGEKKTGEGEAGEGAGAGFRGLVMPVGTYVVKDNDVRWVPAINVTLIALAALAVLRGAMRSNAKARRRHQR
jgi:uncharacterized spore protein YtfJ